MEVLTTSIVGIDPGLSGGLALLSADGSLIEALRMPVLKLNGKGEINLAALSATLHRWQPGHVWIEQQQSMPRQGVASSFRTGQNYGDLRGFLFGAGFTYSIVRPNIWKRAMGVPADKTAAIAIATRQFPAASAFWSRWADDGVAEAALIALYGHRQGSRDP
jgi:crossover junction endodeoxyribonuclease RuvC